MDLALAGRRALVTGGSSGLGLAAAQALAREGCHLAIWAREPRRLAAARERLLAGGAPSVAVLSADLDDDSARRLALDQTERQLGGLDILVANCGNPRGGWIDATTDDDYIDATRKQRAVIDLDRLAARAMADAGGGAIVNVLSRTAVEPDPELALSSVMRAGLLAWGKMLAARLGPSGVRVVSVLPGLTRTAGVEAHLAARGGLADDPADADRRAQREAERLGLPLGRLGTPHSFGRLVAFLASPACDYVTGSAVRFDGGGVRAP